MCDTPVRRVSVKVVIPPAYHFEMCDTLLMRISDEVVIPPAYHSEYYVTKTVIFSYFF